MGKKSKFNNTKAAAAGKPVVPRPPEWQDPPAVTPYVPGSWQYGVNQFPGLQPGDLSNPFPSRAGRPLTEQEIEEMKKGLDLEY